MMVRMRGPRSLAAFVLAFAALLLVPACGGSDPAPNLSSASAGSGSVSSGSASSSAPASPSPSATYPPDVPLTGHNVKPGEKPPVYPAAAAARTQAGANAFAEFFMKTWDWSYATTNPAYMKHYYGPTCGLCDGIATGILKTSAADHYYEGGRFRIYGIQAAAIGSVTAPARYCTRAHVAASAQTVVDKQGNIITAEPAHPDAAFKICVEPTNASWHISYWSRMP